MNTPSTSSKEHDMTTSNKLTDTQTTVLTQAAYRPDGDIEPMPPTLRGGARAKVIDGLASRGLIIEQDGKHVLTDDGYAAIGRTRPAPITPATHDAIISNAEAAQYGASQVLLDEIGGEDPTDAEIDASNDVDPEIEAAVAAIEAQAHAEPKPRTRDNSKQAQVVAMLKRPEGATIPQVMAITGWQAHTVRGTFAGAFKKKLGLNLISEKVQGGDRVYRVG
ncbi:MAG: DUF3489 domain-containing protein [Pseudomonadota bacterium]|nr:DUF3489 domain-containing protein [Pseudomonadota bacterium]